MQRFCEQVNGSAFAAVYPDAHSQAVFAGFTPAFVTAHVIHDVKPADPLNVFVVHAPQFEPVIPLPAGHVHAPPCVANPVLQAQGLDDIVVVLYSGHTIHLVAALVTVISAAFLVV